MKKFLVVLLVLGLATASQAGITGIDFTVNGEPQQPAVTLSVGQTIEIDLELLAGNNILGYVLEWEIIGGRAEFNWSGINFPLAFELASKISGTALPNKVRLTGSQLTQPAKDGPAVIMQGLILTCTGADPSQNEPTIMNVTIRGTTKTNGVSAGTSGTVVHTLTIHQVPEPMTLMLLGLGSLFLVRRKK
jgi:hypothetical protein